MRSSSLLGLSGPRNPSPAREGGPGSSAQPKAPAPVDPTCLLFLRRRPGPESHQRSRSERSQSHPLPRQTEKEMALSARGEAVAGRGGGGVHEPEDLGRRPSHAFSAPLSLAIRPHFASRAPPSGSGSRRVADCSAGDGEMGPGSGRDARRGTRTGASGGPPARGDPSRPASLLSPVPGRLRFRK